VALNASGPRRRVQLLAQGALSADHEARVGMRVNDVGHRLEQHALSGERMKPLDVEQQMAIADSQRCALVGLLVLVVPEESLGDRRINDLRIPAAETELEGSAHEPLAVKRDVRCAEIGACEEIRAPSLPLVVPDFRAIEREHHWLLRSNGEQGGHFGQESVAVDMNEIRPGHRCGERLLNAPGPDRRSELQRAIEESSAASRKPGHRTGEFGPAAGPGRMRHVLDSVSFIAGPVPQLPRQQCIRRLIGRQVRRDVEDPHQPA
jgi:hypothetical protein